MSAKSSIDSMDEPVFHEPEDVSLDYSHYRPAHSGVLVHWTGSDIDETYDPDWNLRHSSKTDSDTTQLYLDRLKEILRHGLWMMHDTEQVEMRRESFVRPQHCRTCFTELRLSAVRGHARRYGRLGIGFKRPFLYARLGAPMIYHQHSHENWFSPRLWSPSTDVYHEFFSCFIKRMTERTSDSTHQYVFYDESEWRIIYSPDIERRLRDVNREDVARLFCAEADFAPEFEQYLQTCGRRPEALIPIADDPEWFMMIIYPSLAAKVEAEADAEIRRMLADMKPTWNTGQVYDTNVNPRTFEGHSGPVEIDLDACRNF